MQNDSRKDIFTSIYPDVDPTQNFPLTFGERLSLALSVGVFMFGGVSGNLLIASIGLGFVVACSLTLGHKTPRRIRAEARSRFPREPWAEQPSFLVPRRMDRHRSNRGPGVVVYPREIPHVDRGHYCCRRGYRNVVPPHPAAPPRAVCTRKAGRFSYPSAPRLPGGEKLK